MGFRKRTSPVQPGVGVAWMRRATTVLLFAFAANARADVDASQWMTVDGNVLELKLAHDEGGGTVDGGVLRVDPTSRIVSWKGIEGEFGCRQDVSASFESVRGVSSGRGAGFAVKLRGRNPLYFIPVVDAQWFRRQSKVVQADEAFGQAVQDGALRFGRTGDAIAGAGKLALGDMGFGGPRVRQVDLPEDVVAHTKLAVDGMLEALGRSPAPGLRVREALYGSPEELDLGEIAEDPGSVEGASIKVLGTVTGDPKLGFDLGAEGATLHLVPTREVESAFRSAAGGGALGEAVFVGVFRQRLASTASSSRPPAGARDASGSLIFWDFERAAGLEAPPKDLVALDHLVDDSKSYEGKVVRVVGKFRGQNLFGDLPQGKNRGGNDFVIKIGHSSAWVTGKRPAGKDWALDPTAPGDTETWLEVVGRVRRKDKILYLRADAISPTTPPSGHLEVAGTRRLGGGGKVPPEIVFILPLPGEPAPRNATFVLQFNQYMDEASLHGRVVLHYLGNDHAFPRMKADYDPDRRALVVQPGELLTLGQDIEVVLLPGILDVDGLPLKAVDGETAYRVRYRVGSAGS